MERTDNFVWFSPFSFNQGVTYNESQSFFVQVAQFFKSKLVLLDENAQNA